jgi:hypothetical protein
VFSRRHVDLHDAHAVSLCAAKLVQVPLKETVSVRGDSFAGHRHQ